MLQFIYMIYLQLSAYGRVRFTCVEQLLRNVSVSLILCRGTAETAVIFCGWRARGDVTSHAVTEARGGPYETVWLAAVFIRSRSEMRGF